MATSNRTSKELEVAVVYYALGGGLGHLTRGLAIARQLQKLRSTSIVLMTNSPHADLAQRESVSCLHIAASDRTTPESLRQQITQRLQKLSPKVIVMDTFPRGVLGEMATIIAESSIKKVLVKRYLNPRYVHAKEVIPFVSSNFDKVISCEPQPELDCQFQVRRASISPVVIRSADELLPRHAARSRLGCRGEEFVVLGVGSGSEEQVRRLFKLILKVTAQLSGPGVCHGEKSKRTGLPTRRPLALKLSSLTRLRDPDWEESLMCCSSTPRRMKTARSRSRQTSGGTSCYQDEARILANSATFSEECRLSYYPLIELMRGVDLVVGASGYNLFYETQCAGVEAIFLPQTRQYDDQFWRAGEKAASGPEELRSMIAERWIDQRAGVTPDSFQNGAVEAAKAIADIERDG